MYTDITGYYPELIDYQVSYVPIRQPNCSVFSDNSFLRTSSILYPENRDDYTKLWSIISAMAMANYMMTFYTAAGGLTFFGLSTLTSVLIGVAFWAITVVAVAAIIYVVVDAITNSNEN
ncbi:MAG: hypothetical protein JEZ05_07475 [Tenericutes bacterium]|nr:hypothetical protein [Mycoplasmatota bacterium]